MSLDTRITPHWSLDQKNSSYDESLIDALLSQFQVKGGIPTSSHYLLSIAPNVVRFSLFRYKQTIGVFSHFRTTYVVRIKKQNEHCIFKQWGIYSISLKIDKKEAKGDKYSCTMRGEGDGSKEIMEKEMKGCKVKYRNEIGSNLEGCIREGIRSIERRILLHFSVNRDRIQKFRSNTWKLNFSQNLELIALPYCPPYVKRSLYSSKKPFTISKRYRFSPYLGPPIKTFYHRIMGQMTHKTERSRKLSTIISSEYSEYSTKEDTKRIIKKGYRGITFEEWEKKKREIEEEEEIEMDKREKEQLCLSKEEKMETIKEE